MQRRIQMAVEQNIIQERALKLASYASQNFNYEELEFFKFYAMLQDLSHELEPNSFEKAWKIWNNRKQETLLQDLAEEIRPGRKFLPETKRARVESIMSKGLMLEHDEQFAILVCAQAELRQISWSLPDYPFVPLHQLPEKWWCSKGEILPTESSNRETINQTNSYPHRPNHSLHKISESEQSYHIAFLLPETKELYLEGRVPEKSENNLVPTILRIRHASGGKIIDPRQYSNLRQERLREDDYIDGRIKFIPVIVCLLWQSSEAAKDH
jgi:hypothetical protein